MCFDWFTKMKNKKIHEKDLKCPRDSRIMKKVKKHEVIIDVCPKCNGMWLDDKEIDKLVAIAKKMQKDKNPEKIPKKR